jgi:hypothetical protein
MRIHRTRERKFEILLVLLSLLAGLLICEVTLRFMRPASDIFPVDPTPDPILGIRLLPFQSGHDGKGFRNSTTGGNFPIVCIGDSMIYGSSVPRTYAIPQQLSRLMHQPVYNMGLGSYGPVQYYQLLIDSQGLHPEKIIISFFLGNDLLDASDIVNERDYWKSLTKNLGNASELQDIKICPIPLGEHEPQYVYQDPNIITLKLKKSGSLLWQAHSFLRLNSGLYALTYESAVKPLIARVFERKVHLKRPGAFYSPQVDTVFLPGVNLSSMDPQNPQVRLGLLITKKVLELMTQLPEVRKKRQSLLFFITPTKENVYYNYFMSQKVALPPQFEVAVYYEREVSRWLQQNITANGFRFVDVLPPMQQAASRGVALYHASSDAHPNSAGNRIIAEALADALKE